MWAKSFRETHKNGAIKDMNTQAGTSLFKENHLQILVVVN